MARKISGKATSLAQGEHAGAGAWPRPQAITPVGGEVRVNTATQFDQLSGKGAALAGGGFVVVWDDYSTTGGATGDTSGSVKLQLFDAAGNKVGIEILANSATASSQGRAAVTALTNGGFVVTWEDYSEGVGGTPGDNDDAAVKAQVFTATGARVGVEILVNSDPAGDQIAGPPVALSGGGFVVSWNTFNGGLGESQNLRAEVFAADGTRVASGLAVDEGGNRDSVIIALDGNRFAVLWTDIGITTPTVIGDREVRIRIYDGNGVPAGDSVVVNGPDSDWQLFDSVSKVAGGGFVVTWTEQDSGGSVFSEIMAQRFDSAGAKIGGEFLVNTVTASYQSGSRVSGLSGGGFVITWTSQDPALSREVRAQVYNAAGVAIGGELNVNTATAASQETPRVVSLAAGGFVILWGDTSQGVGGATGDNNGRAIKGQEYDSAGIAVGTEFLVNTAIRERQQMTDVIALPDGRFAVIWDDASQGLGGATGDTSGLQVKLQVFQGTAGSPGQATSGPDTLNGTSGDDTLDGLGGDDTLNGGAGADVLDGGSGADAMAGGDGNDIFYVDQAGDSVSELTGQGTRDVVYSSASFVLGAGSAVEVLSSSSYLATAAINLTGNELSQEIYGNAGANVLNGRGGIDYMFGFGGDDTYYVDNAGDVVGEAAGEGHDVVYASANYALGAGSSVEVLSADNYDDAAALALTGNEIANEIFGNAGSNALDGGGGADRLQGFGGNDLYYVDDAGDIVIEGAGEGTHDVVYASASYTLTAGQQIEVLSTASYAATTAIDLAGNGFANELYGNEGANTLDGGAGSDYLFGFGGADTFAFTTALGASNIDQILDFSAADDTIALDDAIFAGLATGALAAGAFVNGAAPGDADDRILYDSANGQILFDADGNGAGAAVLFATVSAGTVLTASDFMVI